jgi:hypothetical protein
VRSEIITALFNLSSGIKENALLSTLLVKMLLWKSQIMESYVELKAEANDLRQHIVIYLFNLAFELKSVGHNFEANILTQKALKISTSLMDVTINPLLHQAIELSTGEDGRLREMK